PSAAFYGSKATSDLRNSDYRQFGFCRPLLAVIFSEEFTMKLPSFIKIRMGAQGYTICFNLFQIILIPDVILLACETFWLVRDRIRKYFFNRLIFILIIYNSYGPVVHQIKGNKTLHFACEQCVLTVFYIGAFSTGATYNLITALLVFDKLQTMLMS